MKKLLDLAALMPHLPEVVRDSVNRLAKDEGKDVDDLKMQRNAHLEKALTEGEDIGDRQALKYVSTRTIDKDGEIVVPAGGIFTEFEKTMAFFWGHNYSLPPLGSDKYIKKDDWGIKALSEYGDTGEGTMAEVMWRLVKQGHQKASSIGFVPLSWTEPTANDWDRVTGKLATKWGEFTDDIKQKTSRIITKWVLLEHSDVGLACNNDTSIVHVAKQYGADDAMLKHLGFSEVAPVEPEAKKDPEHKGVIPYHDYGTAEESTSWEGPREIAESDVKELVKICTWFDDSDPELKSSYKLPHHRPSDSKAVWKGVVASMGVLLGARGGVNIPNGDKAGAYAHLAKHYKEFQKEPPEFRGYVQGELKQLFPTLYSSRERIIIPIITPERHVRVLSTPSDLTQIDTAEIVKEVMRLARGGV